MRTIKFRAWDKDIKKFVNAPFKNQDRGTLYAIGKERDCELHQFTGLLDRKGRDIFEGDIVDLTLHVSPYENCEDDEKSHPVIRTVARFESGSFWLTGGGYDICTHFHHDDEDREIIGNIRENPTLL